ncbi:MAG: tail fiber domain-containing protein [Bacteroidota bacterium]
MRHLFICVLGCFLFAGEIVAQNDIRVQSTRISFREAEVTKSFINWNGSLLGLFNNETTGTPDILLRTTRDLRFDTDGATERMRILQNGNIGIGTDNPSSKLDIDHNSTNTNAHLELSEAGSTDYGRINFRNTGVNAYWTIAGRANSGSDALMNFFYDEDGTGPTGGENIMTIDGEDKRVGIGDSTPSAKLDVAGDIRGNGTLQLDRTSSETKIILDQDGSNEAMIEFEDQDPVGSSNHSDLKISNNTAVGSIEFLTGTALTKRMELSANGNIQTNLAAGTFRIGNVSSTQKFQVGGDAGKNDGESEWDIISDKRLKKNIRNFDEGLEVLQRIRPVWFTYNGKLGTDAEAEKVGILAQDMQKIAPYMIGEFTPELEDGKKGETYLNYNSSALKYIIVNSIQEQQNQIEELHQSNDELRMTNDALREQNKALEARLARIEALLSDNVPTNINVETIAISDAELQQNQPNPFSENTTINYFVPDHIRTASLRITDLNGSVLKDIIINEKGTGQVELQAHALSAGSYQYTLILDGQVTATKQMVLTKY